MCASEALQHDWIVGIGVHTDDLFRERGAHHGVPVMQAVVSIVVVEAVLSIVVVEPCK